MATDRRIVTTGLIVWMVLPTALLLLDKLLFHLRGVEAWDYLMIWVVAWVVSVIFQVTRAVKAGIQDRVVLALILMLTALASLMMPLILVGSSTAKNFWSPVF